MARQRRVGDEEQVPERYAPSKDEWNDDLPYGGKVYLARQKKPDTWHIQAWEVGIVVFVFCFAYYAYFYFDHLHFNVTHLYAKVGYDVAQHRIGQHYLSGRGVEKDHAKAMEWFKSAADQGHAHASHNLAVGHLKGYHRLPPGEAHRLFQHAAKNGVPEAQDALNTVCLNRGCE